MKRFLLVTGLVAGIGLVLSLDPPAPRPASANRALPPVARTNAPGEGNCTGCHGGNLLNTAGGSVTILDAPASYVPGQTYALSVAVQRTGQLRWGFEMTALRSNATAAGTFANLNTLTATQSFNNRLYVSHTTQNGDDGTQSNAPSGLWQFNWTAPAAGAGTVTFYATGNAANGDGLNSNDFIYSTTVTSDEGSATDVSATTWGKIKMLYR